MLTGRSFIHFAARFGPFVWEQSLGRVVADHFLSPISFFMCQCYFDRFLYMREEEKKGHFFHQPIETNELVTL